MEIFKQPATAKGPALTFTGDVWVDQLYATADPAGASLHLVRFAPGARTHWHAHRLGQTLRIVEGIARIGTRDGTVIEAHPGTTVHIGPGEDHWHGASPHRSMAHLVLMDGDGDTVPQTEWAEAVENGEYNAPRTNAR
ncbi:cupin domain-containing protein [Streptomyces sp. NPDC005485]|uniref:cupin domain-containing protein n=1 Tax=Streptomyces sp. NPDC005485 TaxID=3155591 RepID=UPI0033A08F38